jgi:hypothetical protein
MLLREDHADVRRKFTIAAAQCTGRPQMGARLGSTLPLTGKVWTGVLVLLGRA